MAINIARMRDTQPLVIPNRWPEIPRFLGEPSPREWWNLRN